jgi:hypothetical protein
MRATPYESLDRTTRSKEIRNKIIQDWGFEISQLLGTVTRRFNACWQRVHPGNDAPVFAVVMRKMRGNAVSHRRCSWTDTGDPGKPLPSSTYVFQTPPPDTTSIVKHSGLIATPINTLHEG